MPFQATLISLINFVRCTVFRPEASKFEQTLTICRRYMVHIFKLWWLLNGKRCTLRIWSWRSKLVEIAFLTNFISMKTLQSISEVPIFLNNGKNQFLPSQQKFDMVWNLRPSNSSKGQKWPSNPMVKNLPYSRCDTNLPWRLDYVRYKEKNGTWIKTIVFNCIWLPEINAKIHLSKWGYQPPQLSDSD